MRMEVVLDRDQVVELLTQNAATLREDLALMEAGTIKLSVFGTDVSHDHARRLRANLLRLESVLHAYGNTPS